MFGINISNDYKSLLELIKTTNMSNKVNNKVFKNVLIVDVHELKNIDIEKSIEVLKKFENEFGSIPIGDGSSNEPKSFNIFSTIMCIENIYLENGFIMGDVSIISDKFKFLNSLNEETEKRMFYGLDRQINFKPIISENGLIRCFNIDNKFSNSEKMRESLVTENKLGLIKDGDVQLKLNICFKIPKGFKGDLNDAILELYRYRTSSKNHDKVFTPNVDKDVYENWWDMVSSTDRRLFGEVSLTELKQGEWTDIEK